MDNIVLIGMPGCGKSTVGVLLAKALGCGFLDTDLLIQQDTGRRLQEILDADGIDAFLKLENRLLAGVDVRHTVIATGGSAVYGEEAMRRLAAGGTVVYLAVDLPVLQKRLADITTRGVVMRQGESLAELFAERAPLYERWADVTVTVPDGSPERTVEAICRALEENGKSY